jgi:hypothetical protein
VKEARSVLKMTPHMQLAPTVQLTIIQSRLIDIGSAIATPSTAAQGAKVRHTRFDPSHTQTLEVGRGRGFF